MRFRVGYGWGFDVVMVGLEWGQCWNLEQGMDGVMMGLGQG